MREGRLIAVERIHDLLGRARRTVTLELADPGDLAELRSLPGVADLQAQDGKVSFRVAGDLDAAIKAIARHRVLDMELTHPSLEEIFLSYYGEGEGGEG